MTIPGFTNKTIKTKYKIRQSQKIPNYDYSIVPQSCDFFTKAACAVFITTCSAGCTIYSGPAWGYCMSSCLTLAGVAKCGKCLGIHV